MTSSRLPIATVVNATGTQGLSITKALSAGGYTIRALTRSPNSAKTLSLLSSIPNVEPTLFDINHFGTLRAAFNNADVVFAMTHPDVQELIQGDSYVRKEGDLNEADQGKRLVDLAKEAGVKLFIWSSVSAEGAKARGFAGTPLSRKLEVNEYLKTAGVPYVALALGVFNENFFKHKQLSLTDEGELRLTVPYGDLNPDNPAYELVSMSHDLGAIIALVAQHFESANLNGKTIYIAERQYSYNEMIKAIEKGTGRKTELISTDFFIIKDSLPDIAYRRRVRDPFPTPELIPDPVLTSLGFKFQTLQEYIEEEIAPIYGLKK